MAGQLFGLACGADEPSDTARVEAVDAEGQLSVRVPAGLTIHVDDVAWTGDEAKAIAAGSHRVAVQTACGEATGTVEIGAGEAVTVMPKDLSGVGWARLSVVAKHRDGTRLDAALWLGDWRVPSAPGVAKAVPAVVPACALRLKVVPPGDAGVGGYWEDVTLQDGVLLHRNVTLLPGPDLVRLAGGEFRIGPPGPEHFIPNYWIDVGDGRREVQPGWPGIPTYDVTVAPFELDRTLVTAEQYARCRTDGGCPVDHGREIANDAPKLSGKPAYELCTTSSIDREVVEGRAEHPANCAALWQAREYCAWVGKRLPTDVEWEFAARSGRSDWGCPWGGTYDELLETPHCNRSERPEESWRPTRLGYRTLPVCTNPWTHSKQGVCDFNGGLEEYVRLATVPKRPSLRFAVRPHGIVKWGRTGRGTAGTDGIVAFVPAYVEMDLTPRVDVGFRCARNVEGAPK